MNKFYILKQIQYALINATFNNFDILIFFFNQLNLISKQNYNGL